MLSSQENAYKFGCGRYIQCVNALTLAGKEASLLGKNALILHGQQSYSLVAEQLESALSKSNVHFTRVVRREPCNLQFGATVARQAQALGSDLIIGVGGGATMDLAKIIADNADLPVMNIPTSSATCAAYTPLAVHYSPIGECLGTVYFPRPVVCVLCDLTVLAHQPHRLMVSGMLDSMAKKIEVEYHTMSSNAFSADQIAAEQLARQIYHAFTHQDTAMLHALEHSAVDPAFEDAVYLAIAATGMVSGIARGRYQSAMGHAFYEDIRTCQPELSAKHLHGELVGLGLLIQETYLGHMERAQELRQWMQKHGISTSFTSMKLDTSPHALDALAAGRAIQPFIGGEKQRYLHAIMAHCN